MEMDWCRSHHITSHPSNVRRYPQSKNPSSSVILDLRTDRMLAADRADLRATLMQRRTQILFKEIELFASQLSTIASIATFLSSMSWAGLMMGPPQLTLTPQFGGVAIRAYYYVVTLAFGTNIFTVATATFVLVWGCVVARIRAVRGVRGKVARGSVRRRRESRVPARDACRHRIALLLPPRVARQQRASRR